MELIIRATVAYFFLLGLTRALGKRELGELSAFELLLLVVVGDLVQQGVTQEDMSLTGAVLAVGTIGFWTALLGYISFKSRNAESAIEGLPVIVVRDGNLLVEAMRNERITHDEVIEGARKQGIGDIAEVRFGVLEPDGKFSFITGDPDKGGADDHSRAG